MRFWYFPVGWAEVKGPAAGASVGSGGTWCLEAGKGGQQRLLRRSQAENRLHGTGKSAVWEVFLEGYP